MNTMALRDLKLRNFYATQERVRKYLDEPRRGTSLNAIKELAEWSLEFADPYEFKPTPLTVFIVLINGIDEAGYLQEVKCLGYKELDLIGKALQEYAERPQDVDAWLDGFLDAETGE